jgi:AhpD family alkylhydroperoxidase
MDAAMRPGGPDDRRTGAVAVDVAQRGDRRALVRRIGLVLLGLPQLAIGVWAIASPHGWFTTFPGDGQHWLPAYGAFDSHLAFDVGAGFVALGTFMLLTAVWLGRRLVQAALLAYLAYAVPHYVFHLANDHDLAAGAHAANDVVLGVTVIVAVGLLVLTLGRPVGPALAPAPASAAGSLLGPPPGGPLTWMARAYGRWRYGGDVRPADAFGHHRKLAMGYAAHELALDRSRRVPARLKALAELRAAAVVGCEWCMDFGSHLARAEAGLSDAELRALARYRESDAFSELDRLVLDYATAMSRTPAAVDVELFGRLRARFDDAEIVELTSAIAIENFRARFNHAVGIEPQGFSEGAACVVPALSAAA